MLRQWFNHFLNNKFTLFSHFFPELLVLLIMTLTVGTNLLLRTNSSKGAPPINQSLFFIYLKNHPELNEKLVQAYESVNLRLTQKPDVTKQILAASTKDKGEPGGGGSGGGSDSASATPQPTLSGSALLKPNPASGAGAPLVAKRDIEVYKVRAGDTVARIAGAYGVDVNTILWENNLSAASYIRPDQELRILPVSGVHHTIKDGETISSIAKKYGLTEPEDIETILEYNEIEIEDHIFPGEKIIIPNGIKKAPPSPQRRAYLADLQREDYQSYEVSPDFQGSGQGLIWPLKGAWRLSQGFWSRHRGVDVPCRDCQVTAAADGIVELSGWQKSYGYTVIINHGGGLKTRYAHGSKLLISAGQTVNAGQGIMITGSTGRSTGPHLHFEIQKNGTLVNPLNSVSR